MQADSIRSIRTVEAITPDSMGLVDWTMVSTDTFDKTHWQDGRAGYRDDITP